MAGKYTFQLNGKETYIDMSLFSEYFYESPSSDAWYAGSPHFSLMPGATTNYFYGNNNTRVDGIMKSLIQKIHFKHTQRAGGSNYWTIDKINFSLALPNLTLKIDYYAKEPKDSNYPSTPKASKSYSVEGSQLNIPTSDQYDMYVSLPGGTYVPTYWYYWKIIITFSYENYGSYQLIIEDFTDTGTTAPLLRIYKWIRYTYYGDYTSGNNNIEQSSQYDSSSSIYLYPYGNSGESQYPHWKTT